MIRAITFDFWDTIAVDDSDEPKRASLGLPGKGDARVQLFVERVTALHPEISPAQAADAYRHGNQQFRHSWHEEHRTPGVSFRIYEAYKFLDMAPQPGRYGGFMREIDDLIREIENMEIRISPDFAPDVAEVLAELSREFRLGIISDTIHTTGRGLRYLLERQGLGGYFSHFIFSDEVGASKPDAVVFRQAAMGLGVGFNQMVHMGDRESNDIVGPKSVGMRAILYTGIVDRGSAHSQADAVCRRYRDLPDIVRRMP
jgi:putative hydrolase of the HAD superfamily